MPPLVNLKLERLGAPLLSCARDVWDRDDRSRLVEVLTLVQGFKQALAHVEFLRQKFSSAPVAEPVEVGLFLHLCWNRLRKRTLRVVFCDRVVGQSGS